MSSAAAGLLALSPLAFACDFGHDDDHGGHNETAGCTQNNSARDERGGGCGGLINIHDVGVQVPVQLCNTSILEGTLGILAGHQRNSDDHG